VFSHLQGSAQKQRSVKCLWVGIGVSDPRGVERSFEVCYSAVCLPCSEPSCVACMVRQKKCKISLLTAEGNSHFCSILLCTSVRRNGGGWQGPQGIPPPRQGPPQQAAQTRGQAGLKESRQGDTNIIILIIVR